MVARIVVCRACSGNRSDGHQESCGILDGVNTRYGPDDEDAFYAARDELVSRFESSPG